MHIRHLNLNLQIKICDLERLKVTSKIRRGVLPLVPAAVRNTLAISR